MIIKFHWSLLVLLVHVFLQALQMNFGIKNQGQKPKITSFHKKMFFLRNTLKLFSQGFFQLFFSLFFAFCHLMLSPPTNVSYVASAAFDSEISSGNEKKWQLVTVKNLFRGSIGQGRTTLMICGLLIEKLLLLFEPKSLQSKVEKVILPRKFYFSFIST